MYKIKTSQNLSFIQIIVIAIIILTRLLIPLIILSHPLAGTLICLLIDAIDHTVLLIFNIRADLKKYNLTYQVLDKLLDQHYYTFIYFYIIHYYTGLTKIVASILYFYRLLGTILFIFSRNNKFPLIFINLFENFAISIFILFPLLAIPSELIVLISIILAISTKIPQEIIAYNRHKYLKHGFAFVSANWIRRTFQREPLK